LLDASRQEIVRSQKQAYCLVNTDAVDLTVEGATWSYGDFTHGSYCGGPQSLWVRENLEAGWADTYRQSIAGQSFDITDLPNGWYYIVVEVNPSGDVLQTTTSNDVERRLLHLRGEPGRRKVLVAPWNGIDA
jgi:hypothetical protein